MKATNIDIAEALTKIAEILEIQGENKFRVRAYERGPQFWAFLPVYIMATVVIIIYSDFLTVFYLNRRPLDNIFNQELKLFQM